MAKKPKNEIIQVKPQSVVQSKLVPENSFQENQNEAELAALEEWKKTGKAHLPLAVAMRLYELYLNYYSCGEICQINGNQYAFGQIVDAKIRYEWDKHREEHVGSLFNKIEKKVYKTKNEALSNLSDLVSIAHKLWNDKMVKFLESGDESLLAEFNPGNLKNYKEILTLLNTLTEVKNISTKKVEVDGTVKHVHEMERPKEKKISSSTAMDLLKLVDGIDNE